jgi:hypothetical protein
MLVSLSLSLFVAFARYLKAIHAAAATAAAAATTTTITASWYSSTSECDQCSTSIFTGTSWSVIGVQSAMIESRIF